MYVARPRYLWYLEKPAFWLGVTDGCRYTYSPARLSHCCESGQSRSGNRLPVLCLIIRAPRSGELPVHNIIAHA